MRNHLPLQEWIIVILISLVFIILALVTYLNEDASLPPAAASYEITPSAIHVTVNGSVQNPGTFTLKLGARLEEVIALSQPNPEADLRLLRLKSPLRNKQKIDVPAKTIFTILVLGAVEKPGIVEVYEGTRLNELEKFIKLLPEADKKSLQRKRLIRKQETIHIPCLKVGGKNDI